MVRPSPTLFWSRNWLFCMSTQNDCVDFNFSLSNLSIHCLWFLGLGLSTAYTVGPNRLCEDLQSIVATELKQRLQENEPGDHQLYSVTFGDFSTRDLMLGMKCVEKLFEQKPVREDAGATSLMQGLAAALTEAAIPRGIVTREAVIQTVNSGRI